MLKFTDKPCSQKSYLLLLKSGTVFWVYDLLGSYFLVVFLSTTEQKYETQRCKFTVGVVYLTSQCVEYLFGFSISSYPASILVFHFMSAYLNSAIRR